MTDSVQRLGIPIGQATESTEQLDRSYGRTDGRTNAESWLRTGDTFSSVTRARTYDDSPFADLLHEAIDALEAAATGQRLGTPGRGNRQPIDPWLRRAIYWRDANRCGWCSNGWGDENNPLVLDHIKPWSAGGSDRSDNLRTLCKLCNEGRSNFASDSWVRVTPVGFCDQCHAQRGWPVEGETSTPIFCGRCGLHRVASDPRRVL